VAASLGEGSRSVVCMAGWKRVPTLRVNLLTCDELRRAWATLTIEVLGLTLVAAASTRHTKHGARHMSSRVESLQFEFRSKSRAGFLFSRVQYSLFREGRAHLPRSAFHRARYTTSGYPSTSSSTVKRNGDGASERQRPSPES
jgi:hypothetical protein